MNVNVWDVNEHVQALIRRSASSDAEELADPGVPLDALAADAARAVRGAARCAASARASSTSRGRSRSWRSSTARPTRSTTAAPPSPSIAPSQAALAAVGRRRRLGRHRRRAVRAGPRGHRRRGDRPRRARRAALAAASDVVISVDTFQPEVAAAAIAAGADVINDTSGLCDPDMAAVVADERRDARAHAQPRAAAHAAPVARSTTMSWPRSSTSCASGSSWRWSRRRPGRAASSSIPGHDLNKNTLHSLELTRRLDEVAALGPPDPRRALEQGLHRRDASTASGTTARGLARRGGRLHHEGRAHRADARRARRPSLRADDRGDPRAGASPRTWSTTC